jgi:hypothetical protein
LLFATGGHAPRLAAGGTAAEVTALRCSGAAMSWFSQGGWIRDRQLPLDLSQ